MFDSVHGSSFINHQSSLATRKSLFPQACPLLFPQINQPALAAIRNAIPYQIEIPKAEIIALIKLGLIG